MGSFRRVLECTALHFRKLSKAGWHQCCCHGLSMAQAQLRHTALGRAQIHNGKPKGLLVNWSGPKRGKAGYLWENGYKRRPDWWILDIEQTEREEM